MIAGNLPPTKPRDFRRLLLAGLYGVAAFSGFADALSVNALVYWLIALLWACFATAWCVADASRRGAPLLPVLQMIMFLLWPIAVPIYLVTSRGWRGLGYAVLHAFGLTAASQFSFLATYFIVYGTGGLESP